MPNERGAAMSYEQLSKLFHMDNSSERFATNRALAQERLTADATFRTGITTQAGELFLAVPHELSLLNESVLRMERRISLGLSSLPGVARGWLIRNLVINEVVSTNELENIHSTRRQISEVLEESSQDERALADKRFRELAKLYLGLSDPHTALPERVEDIRAIYDQVMAGEKLGSKDMPDGRLFRSGQVEVLGDGNKVLHEGVYPEAAIIEGLGQMMALAESDEIPQTYSAIACHYVFEHIHPFYDGNGRTGRYLLALYLSRPLSTLTTLSLSGTIAENKSRYYKSFKGVEDPLNHGELTFFVIAMLQNIQEAQLALVDRLDKSASRLSRAMNLLDALSGELGLSEHEQNLMGMLLQVALYGAFPTATLDECATFLHLSKQSARKYLARLEGRGLVLVQKKRPLMVQLSQAAMQRLELDHLESGQ